jgi:hypothetical protein
MSIDPDMYEALGDMYLRRRSRVISSITKNRTVQIVANFVSKGRPPSGILLPLSRSRARPRQVLLIECFAYQRLDYCLATDIQLFDGRIHNIGGSIAALSETIIAMSAAGNLR